jgi:hypothetical protein
MTIQRSKFRNKEMKTANDDGGISISLTPALSQSVNGLRGE